MDALNNRINHEYCLQNVVEKDISAQVNRLIDWINWSFDVYYIKNNDSNRTQQQQNSNKNLNQITRATWLKNEVGVVKSCEN